ncbi:MAG: hypothetical protein OEV28_02100 [Nitrospirota bacterium]|nr:hypothetical protein [Nitrospirota bacterium]
MLEHAYRHVPYYRRVFEGIGATPADIRTLAEMEKLPILTKEIIRENFEDLIATNIPKEHLIANSTGGSTGEPLRLYQDRQYEQWANAARNRGWYEIAGCRPGDNCAVLWGAMHEIGEDFPLKERLRSLLTTGEIPLNAFNLSEERKRYFLKWCHMLRPRLLRGYVTAIHDFAGFLDANNLRFPQVQGVILCAETVDPHVQAFVEKVFKAPSYNTYGGRELSLIAMECEHKNGLHEISENNYVEFEPITLTGYQDAGNLLITNLNNYAMPFIRYRIGDIGIPGNGKQCECGRGLPLVSKVIGRTTEVFVFADGTRIAGEMFIHLMKDFSLKEYQFVQVSDSRVVLRMKSEEFNDLDRQAAIREKYARYLPVDARLDFEKVDGFEKTATGKFRFVFRQMNAVRES